MRSFRYFFPYFEYDAIRRLKFILRAVICSSKLQQKAAMLDVSPLGASKVALRHLSSVLLIGIYFHAYAGTMAQFLVFPI